MSDALNQILDVLKQEAIDNANVLIEESKALMQAQLKNAHAAQAKAEKERDEAVAKRDAMRTQLIRVITDLDLYVDGLRVGL